MDGQLSHSHASTSLMSAFRGAAAMASFRLVCRFMGCAPLVAWGLG